jgi:flagellar L-ring protein FlgH
VNDIVTIVVADRASAVSSGTTAGSRQSEAKASIKSLAGPTRVGGVLSSLADLGSDVKLNGKGSTSRESTLTTTLSARVSRVLPNGDLVVEGSKQIVVNSEHQLVSVRGVVRWNELSASNRVSSDRLAALEVKIDGKGVVNDSIRRPNFLYRLLLGLLPF